MKDDLAVRVKEATSNLLDGLSLELVDVTIGREKGRTFIRIAVDKYGGVTVDECASASRLIGQVLDRESLISDRYVLEVSSPGVNRVLRSPEEFIWSIGKTVKVIMRQPLEGKTSYRGIVRNAGQEYFMLGIGEELMKFDYAAVSKAELDPDLPW